MTRRTREKEIVADSLKVANSARFGDADNNLSVASDGTLTLNGNATVWKDMVISIAVTRLGGVADPDFAKIADNGSGSTGIFGYHFDKAIIEQVHFDIELPHDYKEGSTIYPHVHWLPTTTGTGVVVWGLEYAWVNIGSAVGNTTVITGSEAGTGTAYDLILTSLGTGGIAGTGKTRSSSIIGRLFRFATDAADTYNADAVCLDIDFHYEIDSLGDSTLPGS